MIPTARPRHVNGGGAGHLLSKERRDLLAGLAGAAALLLLPAKPRAAAPGFPSAPPPPVRFEVLRGNDVIGKHAVDFQQDGKALVVHTNIEIAVKMLGVNVFEFRHDSKERWQDGRLQAFDSKTLDDDSEFFVTGRATAEGFQVTSKKGVEMAPADIMVGSYWTPLIAQQSQLLDPQRGRLKTQQLISRDQLQVPVGTSTVKATRYSLQGVTDGWVAYDDGNRWVAAQLRKKGSDILYRLPA